MTKFICRVCGNSNYDTINAITESFNNNGSHIRQVCFCTNCGTVFSDPKRFCLPTMKFKKLDENATEPTKSYTTDTGFDLYACEEKVCPAGKVTKVKTGITFVFPDHYGCQVRCRSGMGSKGLSLANGVGTVDNEYRGDVSALILNTTEEDYLVSVGDRVTQVIFEVVFPYELEETFDDETTNRGENGWGSSGN